MASSNVLRVNAVEEQSAYRDAVAQILIDVQRATRKTHVEIAEEIDVSLGTISNAANKKTDLNATYLGRIGKRYGAHFLDPYAALCGARFVPLQPDNVRDILPLLARANLKIAEARDPQSPGGAAEVPQEKQGYLPHLKELVGELSSLICSIEAAA